LLVASKRNFSDDIVDVGISYKYALRALSKLSARLVSQTPDYYFNLNFHLGILSASHILKYIPFKPDVIFAHSISSFLTPKHLYALNKLTGSPIVWYVVDAAPFTGGCHFSWDCDGYISQCGRCPALYSSSAKDLSYWQLKFKRKYVQKSDIAVIACTSLQAMQISKSVIFSSKPIEKIMLSTDPEIFRPISKEMSRAILNLPRDKKIIFFGAESLNYKRKGMGYLLDALNILRGRLNEQPELKERILVIFAGKSGNDDLINKIPFPNRNLGFLNDDRILAMAYQASDLFVSPSVDDAGPLMINEAIMCGTPVVSFNIGVAPDLVIKNKTGYAAEAKDSEDLANGMYQFLQMDSKRIHLMSEDCRNISLRLYHPQAQLQKIMTFVNTLINQNRKHSTNI
jgi:glycosyltransferase involved in cell wall biosynthesis